MTSSSVTVLDPTSDVNNAELARMSKVYEFPAFVKKAELESTMRPQRAAISSYADPRFRRYPCHTAAATWLSGLYFQEKQAEYHPKERQRIEQRLDHYADYFGIRRSYDAMCKRAADLHTPNELPDSHYAYVWAGEDGVQQRFMPMRSAMEVKAASDWLETYRDRLPYHDRHAIANKIIARAQQTGAGLGNVDFLEKQAGMGVCDPDEVVAMLNQRAHLTKTAQHREALLRLAESVKTQPQQALVGDQLVKLATVVDMTDRALGLYGKYTDLIQRPEDVIFKVTFTKAAGDCDTLCALTSGNVYSKDAFEKLSYDDVEALFGTDFAQEVSNGLSVDAEKMATVAHTLPRPDAELLDTLMADAGLRPELAKAASDGHGMSLEDLEALAATYERV